MGSDREDDAPVDNVVPLHDKQRRSRGGPPKPAPELPAATGVAAMGGDPLLENLRASMLSDETIDASRMFTLNAAAWRPYGFRSARPQSGILIPFFAPGAAQPFAYRLRPQFPLPTKKKGKFKKYDQQWHLGSIVYTPPLAATVDRLQSIGEPLIWTEGEKKALLLAQLGWCVVGLTGVDNWHDVAAYARGDGRKLHPYIEQHYLIAGRAHVICFDADARRNPNVMLAISRLAGLLTHLGAASVHMCLPPDSGGAKGIDDYAKSFGLEACANLLRSVREPVEEIAPDLGCVPIAHYGDTFIGSGAERLRMPRGYEAERDGSIWFTEDVHRPEERTLVLDAPMVLARQFVDVYSGEIRSEVRFRDARGAWRSALVPREVLGDRSLVQVLRPYGALVNNGSANAVMRYLDAFERDNGPLIEQARCVPQTGWHEEQFVLAESLVAPSSNAQPIRLDGSPGLTRLANAVRPHLHSSANKHVDALRIPFQASPECALAILAALSAPLLRLLNQSNFALHLCGDSSRGKTSMLRVAASVYGDPFAPGWVASWNTTMAGLEHRAGMLNDLPQFYDEVGGGDVEQLQRAVYMLINGEGRQRVSRDLDMRATLGWRTVVVSTGEPELATEQDTTGVQARVINVPVSGFGALGAAEIETCVRACAEQHGALGRAWLEMLVALTEEERFDLRTDFAMRARELRAIAERHRDRVGQRTAGYFAAMQIAEELLHDMTMGRIGREHGLTAREAFAPADGSAPDSRVQTLSERVVEALRGWVLSEPRAFPMHDNVPHDALKVHGYRRLDGVVGFLPNALHSYLHERGLPLTRAVKRELVADGLMFVEASQRAAGNLTYRMSVNGTQQRVVALRLDGCGESLYPAEDADGFENSSG